MLKADNLDVTHGFFGRAGGVSDGIFASLNCGPGSGDAREKVIENRRRVSAALGGGTLLTLHQVHSGEAVAVGAPWPLGEGPKADAMATNLPGLALGILTADCAPVLFADEKARVIGAAHAGWKGALAGVTDSVLDAMERLGASRARVAACIGPCISQANYEVAEDFRARFLDADPANAAYFAAGADARHHQFALSSYVLMRLKAAGIADARALDACTYAGEAEYFSFRRATHRGEKDYGRQVSAIVIP